MLKSGLVRGYPERRKGVGGWDLFAHKLSYLVFTKDSYFVSLLIRLCTIDECCCLIDIILD
jgi:hypothetical protein